MNEIIIDTKTAEKRFAVKKDGVVSRIFVEQPKDQSEVGNIYYGIVESVKAGMNAAFVNIGKRKNGFLQRDQLPSYIHCTMDEKDQMPISKFVREGEKILVQVKKDETGSKGPLLSAVLEFPGQKSVYMPEGKYIAVSKKGTEEQREAWRAFAKQHKHGGEGFIIRTEAFSSSEEEWQIELEELRTEFDELKKNIDKVKAPALLCEKSRFYEELSREIAFLETGRIVANSPAVLEQLKTKSTGWTFHFHQQRENIFTVNEVDKELGKALKQTVWLENGAYLVINETEAAVIVDVNTGKFTGKQAVARTILKTNVLAAVEIARQLQLRDYGGIILIDFIDMASNADRKKVQNTLEKELLNDPKQTRAIGFTPLGIFEVTRKRTKQSLTKTLLTECPVCRGAGRITSPETAAFRLERELWELAGGDFDAVLIECDQVTRAAFSGENGQHLTRIEKQLHIKIFFKEMNYGAYGYELRQFGTVEEIQSRQ